jgi:PAS domain S-box-containing protein
MLDNELNKYWKTVVDTIQEGIMIVDTGGTVISINEAFTSMTGYSPEEIIGKPCTVLHCNACETARKADGAHWCRLFGKGKIKQQRCVLMRKDESYIQVLKNASVFFDEEGNEIGAVETLADITELIEKDTQIEVYRRELQAEDGFYGILGVSAPMQRVFDLIINAAQSDAPVLISGESGTGKELVAQAIHETGIRKDKPFVKVNCAALTESILESELFGHVKGAFTGAYRSREGRFEAAHGGDIFLDEIGELPLATQVKLLRVLEQKVLERVGDNRPIHVDVRIICATNRKLRQLVEQKAFREDLFYRVNVIPVYIPPLRERVGDIPLLAESFFRRIRLKSNKEIEGISKDTMELLMTYSWPGNVRELKSAFEYAFVSCQESFIQPYHLPPAIQPKKKASEKPVVSRLSDREKRVREELIDALEKSGGNQSDAARMLGVSRMTVRNRMLRFGIRAGRKIET